MITILLSFVVETIAEEAVKKAPNKEWGEYYFAKGGDYPAKNKWALKLLHLVNESVPRFTDIFDEDTFYLFAAVLVLSTFVLAFFLSRIWPLQDPDVRMLRKLKRR